MPHYQVSLYKDLLSSDGHPFHCLQSIVEVDADAPDSAINSATSARCSRSWTPESGETRRGI